MKKSIVRGLASTLALSVALAACTKNGDRGLNQEEQAKLDGIAAREAAVAKTKEELAAKEAELNQKTADLQSQASNLESEKQKIEQDKTDFNKKLVQLESDKRSADQTQARLADETAKLSQKQQRTAQEEQRLQELAKQQADLKAAIEQKQAELETERAQIQAKGQELKQREDQIRADIQNLNTDIQAARSVYAGTDGMNLILHQLVGNKPVQMLVMVLGIRDCDANASAAVRLKVSQLASSTAVMQDEKYNADVCGARYLITTNSAQKLKELQDAAVKNNFIFSVYAVDKINARSFLTVETTEVGNTNTESSAPILVHDSGEVTVNGPMTREQIQQVSKWSTLPLVCSTPTPECLRQLTISSSSKSDLKKSFETSRDQALKPGPGWLSMGAKPKMITGLKITHSVYAVGPKRNEVALPSMPEGFVDGPLSTQTLFFNLPVNPEVKTVKFETGDDENTAAKLKYIETAGQYIKALE